MTAPASLTSALSGRYAFERELGRGGMAVVYLARDLKHNRPVAVKLLNPEIAAVIGPDRFLSEIRITAAMQHPNLLPLFDSGEVDGMLYYVMPFVAGESLRARLDRERQLPVGESLHIACAVASALDYAHRQSVVHRDLKPENILLHEGEPLVADFGIALALTHAGGARLTQTGVSVGTPQYMSPEQAVGERGVDRRADIYALGAVLYEMLTGEAPHTGPTTQAVVARVVNDPVRPIRATRDAVSPHIDRVVLRALAKVPADRWSTAADFAAALRGAEGGPQSVDIEVAADTPHSRRRAAVVIAASGIVVGALATLAVLRASSNSGDRSYAFVVTLPDSAAISTGMGGTGGDLSLSRDGRTLVYLAGAAGGGDVSRGIWVRPLDEIDARPVRGLEHARLPRFSPDGRTLAYTEGGTLNSLTLSGGRSTRITDRAESYDWVDNETIVFSRGSLAFPDNSSGAELWITTIRNPRPRLGVRRDTTRHIVAVALPSVLPGGHAALVTIWKGDGTATEHEIALASLDDGSITELGLAGTTPRYAQGQLLFVKDDGTLNSVQFSARRGKITGEVVQLAPSVVIKVNGWADFDVSDDGTISYVAGSEARRHLVLVDRSGRAQRLGTEVRRFYTPRFSNDGRSIAVEIGSMSGLDIWTYDRQSRTLAAVTNDRRSIRPSGWIGGDSAVVYLDADSGFGRSSVRARSADGRLDREIVPRAFGVNEASVGGRVVAFRSGRGDVLLSSLDGNAKLTVLVPASNKPGALRLSQDGRFLAFEGSASGTREIFVQATAVGAPRLQISSGGGTEPNWSRRGDEVFYRGATNFIVAKIAFDPMRVVRRDTLFRDTFLRGAFSAGYDVSPNGDELVVVESEHPDVYPTVLVNKLRPARP